MIFLKEEDFMNLTIDMGCGIDSISIDPNLNEKKEDVELSLQSIFWDDINLHLTSKGLKDIVFRIKSLYEHQS